MALIHLTSPLLALTVYLSEDGNGCPLRSHLTYYLPSILCQGPIHLSRKGSGFITVVNGKRCLEAIVDKNINTQNKHSVHVTALLVW